MAKGKANKRRSIAGANPATTNNSRKKFVFGKVTSRGGSANGQDPAKKDATWRRTFINTSAVAIREPVIITREVVIRS